MKNGIKGYLAGVLTCVMLFGAVFAASPAVREIFFGVQVSINGEVQNFDDDMQPFIMDGRTFLPVRGIADALGVGVDFDETENMVLLGQPRFVAGSRTAADYLNAHSQAALDDIIAQVRTMGMELEMTTDGDVIIYTYTFIEQIVGSDFMFDDSMLRAVAETVILPEMSNFGVANPVVRYIYINADGTILADMEFSLDLVDMPDMPNFNFVDFIAEIPAGHTLLGSTWAWDTVADYVYIFNADGTGTRGFPGAMQDFNWAIPAYGHILMDVVGFMVESWSYEIVGNVFTITSNQVPGMGWTYIRID